MAVQNTGDAPVFFDVAQDATATDDLISAQVDPTQPQVDGLTPVTSPLVPDRHVSSRVANFDPETFDLSDTSHLMRLLSGLMGAGGVGGLRRQMTMARMSNTLQGTNWLELDGFWGKLFSLPRDPNDEGLPPNEDGDRFSAESMVADSKTWDTIQGRDGKYRSRIEQLAKGFAAGATYQGVTLAAQALLNCDVEIIESWTVADSVSPSTPSFTGNTWFAVMTQHPTWGELRGLSYSELDGGVLNFGDTPTGNRGEVVVIPGRAITEAERWTLAAVLNQLVPATNIVTVARTPFSVESTVPTRDIEADSNDWHIVSQISQQQAIDTGNVDLYPAASSIESGRPGMASYAGEKWAYNGRFATIDSYTLDANDEVVNDLDYDVVVFDTGTRHEYVARDAAVSSTRTSLARAGADGVLTTYPYADGRTSA